MIKCWLNVGRVVACSETRRLALTAEYIGVYLFSDTRAVVDTYSEISIVGMTRTLDVTTNFCELKLKKDLRT